MQTLSCHCPYHYAVQKTFTYTVLISWSRIVDGTHSRFYTSYLSTQDIHIHTYIYIYLTIYIPFERVYTHTHTHNHASYNKLMLDGILRVVSSLDGLIVRSNRCR